MTECPVCCTPDAERGRDRDYGELRQIDCRRCGLFTITATAIAVLRPRLAAEAGYRARLSHQLRLASDKGQPLVVNTHTFEELLSHPLPGPQEQVSLLLQMLSHELGENHFGEVRFVENDLLAAVAVVGANDRRSIDRLIKEAIHQDLISQRLDVTDRAWWLSLRPAGWDRLNLSSLNVSTLPAESVTLRRSQPHWTENLADEALRGLMREIYAGLDHGLLALPLMGARAAFDRAMFLLIGDPPGGFRGKLTKLKVERRLSDREIGILEPMIDAGSAAAHRGVIPSADIVRQVVDKVEHVLRDWFVRDQAALTVKAATPPR
jgi:hypothetical protein